MRHARHHYVPKFLLRQWAGQDKKLACYSRHRGRILVSRLSPKSVAVEEGLYSLEHGSEERRQAIEREVFGQIDDNAARSMRTLLDAGVRGLDARARGDWALFLLSLRVRSPRLVRHVKATGTTDLLNILSKDPEEYESLRKDSDPRTLTEWLHKHDPEAIGNYGVSLLPELIQHDVLVNHIYRMHWWMQRVGDDHEFFISDHPCVYTKGLGDANCLIALPLGPQVVFFAANRPNLESHFQMKPHNAVTSRLNQSIVSQAMKYAYDRSGKRRLFVQKLLSQQN